MKENAKILINDFSFQKMVTTTTRKKRKNEVNHIDYHFVTEKKFIKNKDYERFKGINYKRPI